jgi:adenine-specific DNA-methyltransferase
VKSGEDMNKELVASSPEADLVQLRKRLAELEQQQKFGLVWREIQEDVEVTLRNEIPVLVPDTSLNVPGKIRPELNHVLIEGDNLHALHVLQATHRNSIDVIYIDPPYNTGSKSWMYNNNYIDNEDTFRHSKWLSFMNKRLILAKNLLQEGGIIVVAIDDYEIHTLRLLMDQLFGEHNRLGSIVVQHNPRGRNDDRFFATSHEYLLIYANDATKAAVGNFPLNEDDVAAYNKNDSISPYNLTSFIRTGNNSTRQSRPNLFYPIYFNPKSGELSLTNSKGCIELLPINEAGEEKTWRWGRDTFDELKGQDIEVREVKGTYRLFKKRRLQDGQGKRPKTVWVDSKYDASGSGIMILQKIFGKKDVFPYPKSLYAVKDVLYLLTKKDSVVLDFFAGSGTTLHAVAELNSEDEGSRVCIVVTNDEGGICRKVTQPRCKAVLQGTWKSAVKAPLPGSLSFYSTGFIKRFKSPDRMRTEIAKHTVDLIAIKEGAGVTTKLSGDLSVLHGLDKTIAVAPGLAPDHTKLHAAAEKKARSGDTKIAYLFTWGDNGVEEEVAALWPGWEIKPLPAEMLAALRRLIPPARLFDDHGGAS